MTEPIVTARGLTKRFGDFTAVDGIDFDIPKGKAFGFLGPNGAGKTSTMKMMTTVSPITEGKMIVFGLDPMVDGRSIRQRLGVVPQEDNLDLDLTGRRRPARREARNEPVEHAGRRRHHAVGAARRGCGVGLAGCRRVDWR